MTEASAALVDWPPGDSGTAKFLRNHDWSQTSLGSVETWSLALRTAVEIMLATRQPACVAWGSDRLLLYNDALAVLLGERHPAALGRPLADAWNDARQAYRPIIEAVLNGRSQQTADLPLGLMPESGAFARSGWTWTPLRNEAGVVAGFHCTANAATTDFADGALFGAARERSEERERRLMLELQHRTRNMLAVIRSIVRRSAETAASPEDYATHLEGRIDAFARVQSAAARDPLGGVDLGSLLADELLAAAAREGDQVTIEGPPITLRAKSAETLGLAIHELTTNAIKFGALGAPRGHIAIRWSVGGEAPLRRLVLEWKESGVRGPPPREPREGFGTELLDRTLDYQLGAKVERRFEPNGLRCRIEMPLTERIIAENR
ncbi:HWE histidine kinase domain-containing protein [Consotaella salsifontis]|uniref:histidine kinase n=1 Tax=Consotaella salsifontis TaxID=1365950 RepID=A0A1T4SEZ5_9HYPH|nr:HWE histidine kinase domain-containing protein [Consotaella salsifontis]SKA26900.1 Two-component sensor histidine kinase, contains HisKA and HATPase domains [Consotaella salsifontis]